MARFLCPWRTRKSARSKPQSPLVSFRSGKFYQKPPLEVATFEGGKALTADEAVMLERRSAFMARSDLSRRAKASSSSSMVHGALPCFCFLLDIVLCDHLAKHLHLSLKHCRRQGA